MSFGSSSSTSLPEPPPADTVESEPARRAVERRRGSDLSSGRPVVTVSQPVGGILFPGPLRGSRSVTIHLCGLPVGASALLRAPRRTSRPSHCSALLRVGVTQPPRSLPTLVRSYRTVSPLPVPAPRGVRAIGGLLSVALYRQIAPTWLSPAPCSVESRPSSTPLRGAVPRSPDRLTDTHSVAPGVTDRQRTAPWGTPLG